MPKIAITCQYSKLVPLETLIPLQGQLKKINATLLEKLKKSIVELGFSFPVFVWGDYILDGHQRITAALPALIAEGYTIDGIPVVEVVADSLAHAAEKLLAVTSRYGDFFDVGVFDFLNEFNLDENRLDDMVRLPDIDFAIFDDALAKTALAADLPVDTRVPRRKLGDNAKKIRPVLYAADIKDFEAAIMATGCLNYAAALMEICRFYLARKVAP